MVGPGRGVKGGISTVVNSYYDLGLDKKVELRYIASMEDGNKLKKLLVAVRAYIKFCLILDSYDIVHVHMAAQASFIRKSLFIKRAYKRKTNIIIHQHGGNFDGYFLAEVNNKKRQKIKSVFAMADIVLVLSCGWADFFERNICEKNKVVVLHNGVVIPQYEKENYTDHNVLFLGKLGKEKGAYDLLEAIPQVIDKVPDAIFYFGGVGELKICERIAQSRSVGNRVKFLGWVSGREKEKYLINSSIFILPSYYEGMPMSVLEAMSYGMAAVASNVGGIAQIIEDGVNGICIEAGNIGLIVDVLIDLMQNEEKRRRLGQAAAKSIRQQFDITENIKQLYRLYLELLG